MTNSDDPPTARGRAMRDRIVEQAAARVFNEGARAASLDDIRNAAGASKSQVYHYFSSKDELLTAVVEFQSRYVIDAQMPELGAIESMAGLRRWSRKLVQLAGDHAIVGGCPIGSLANELGGQSGHHGEALIHAFERWREEIEHALRRMRARGELDDKADVAALSSLFLSAIQGGLLFAKTYKSAEPLNTSLRQLLKLLEAPQRKEP